MPTCPECSAYVRTEDRTCPRCGFEADFAELGRTQKAARAEKIGVALEQSVIESEQQRAAEETRRAQVAAVHLSTLPYVPGHDVIEAVGLVNAEIVIGQGVFAQVSNEVTNILGIRGSAFEAKWKEIREVAKATLKERAVDMGCNAVIGVDSEVTALSGATVFHQSLMVVLNGTAVKIVPNSAGR